MLGKGENQKYVLKLPGYPLHSPVVSFWHPACRNMGLKKRGAPRCTIGRRCRGGHTEGRGFPSPPARKKPSEDAQNPYLPGGNEMKKIRVNIKPFKLDSVKSSLSEASVHGHPRHVRERERCRGSGRSVGHLHAPGGIRKARNRHKPQWDPGMTACGRKPLRYGVFGKRRDHRPRCRVHRGVLSITCSSLGGCAWMIP